MKITNIKLFRKFWFNWTRMKATKFLSSLQLLDEMVFELYVVARKNGKYYLSPPTTIISSYPAVHSSTELEKQFLAGP